MRGLVGRILLIVGILVVYAYGFQVTQIDLEEPQKPKRQEQLVRIIRGLARPDLVEWDRETQAATAAIFVPCTDAEPPIVEAMGGPAIRLSAACGEPGDLITVEGFGFRPNTGGSIRWVTPAGNRRPLELIRTDGDGDLVQQVAIPSAEGSDEPYHLEAEARWNVGAPRPSETTLVTWDKIVETVFLALLATTFGTMLAVPVSFLAAGNLMRQVASPIGGLVTAVVALPIGAWLGFLVAGAIQGTGVSLGGQLAGIGALAASPVVVWLGVRAATQAGGAANGRLARYGQVAAAALAFGVLFFALALVAGLAKEIGARLQVSLGAFGFLGNFLFVLADGLGLLLPAVGAVVGAVVLSSVATRTYSRTLGALPMAVRKASLVGIAATAGATALGLAGAGIGWLYELEDPRTYLWMPAAAGAAIAGLASLPLNPDREIEIGLSVYYATRSTLNFLRAIEPLIMVVVFAVWVGIGPFAGVLALTLHSVAALGKLYSEQAESILPGPIEAVTATGANRLQTIVYGVIPQIIPPYIAFTIYRWDINVRMSTIIGFGGGGGIGFVLQQNINLLRYRQASVMMIAIAIVVATLDFVSAKVRQRYV